MQVVLGIATALGLLGVIETFGLFFLADKGLHINHDVLQSMMYLKLSVAGHLTVFVARTRGPFWSVKPARILLFAVIGTQVVATFIATYGFLMTPLGWKWAGLVWIYAFAGFFVEDATKLLAYRALDAWQRRSSGRGRTVPSPAPAS